MFHTNSRVSCSRNPLNSLKSRLTISCSATAAFQQHLLDQTKAQREAKVQPHRMRDDRRRKPMALVAAGGRSHVGDLHGLCHVGVNVTSPATRASRPRATGRRWNRSATLSSPAGVDALHLFEDRASGARGDRRFSTKNEADPLTNHSPFAERRRSNSCQGGVRNGSNAEGFRASRRQSSSASLPFVRNGWEPQKSPGPSGASGETSTRRSRPQGSIRLAEARVDLSHDPRARFALAQKRAI